jgi:2,3-bisphosphoglycerate-independent phosphoglycerate mutase
MSATTRAHRRPRPLVVVVLDGFGIGTRPEADAIASARLPVWHGLLEQWPHAQLDASGAAVGLPAGQMGNSEVGHLNLGAGQPVIQDLPRIDAAVADGSFFKNQALLDAIGRAAAGRRLHLIGLLGPGGVHSVDRHAVAIARLAWQHGARDIVVHGLLDGRDTPPRSAVEFVPDFETRLHEAHPQARIATIGGRYFGMDRDKRWERIKAAYDAIVDGRGDLVAGSPTEAVTDGYARGEGDEFVQPTLIEGVDGTMRDGDAVIHFNFRADRARQLIHALVDGDEFDRTCFDRGQRPRDLLVVTMTEYESGLPVEVAYPPLTVTSLAEFFSSLGWRQFHVAETEKYAHVTYFFNGGVEQAFPGEERLLVPSLKVATYDLQPEMSAAGVTDALLAAIGDDFDFIVANFANADMVGHSGVWDATVAAVEYVDGCLGRVVAAMPHDGLLCITADHGNADELRDVRGNPMTAHSLNRVPVVLIGDAVRGRRLHNGVLADVAPTLLELVDLEPPPSMTGHSLLDD